MQELKQNIENMKQELVKMEARLIEEDKFKELKRVYGEGAEIEFYEVVLEVWINTYNNPLWHTELDYRIKDNISIESWDKHKEVIKEYWNGGEAVEYRFTGREKWSYTSVRDWGLDREYRIKPQYREELTVQQIEAKLGYKIKIVGDK